MRCAAVERGVVADRRFADLSKKFILVRIDTRGRTPEAPAARIRRNESNVLLLDSGGIEVIRVARPQSVDDVTAAMAAFDERLATRDAALEYVLSKGTPLDAGAAARVDALVARLGDSDYRVREEASNGLLALGEPARRRLGGSAEPVDPEARARFRAVLARFAELEQLALSTLVGAEVPLLERRASAGDVRARAQLDAILPEGAPREGGDLLRWWRSRRARLQWCATERRWAPRRGGRD